MKDSTQSTVQHRVACCVSTHVRNTLSDPESLKSLKECIFAHTPFVRTGFAMVAMIDISGYSSITSSLTALGKLSSELITNTVGSYMDQVVTVIFAFGGDVIKFLGDAILICFSKLPGESESELAERATYCCLYISAHLKSVSIDLDKAVQDYKRHTYDATIDSKATPNSAYTSLGNPPAAGLSAYESVKLTDINAAVTLEIHVALTSGMVEHVIMGLEGKRMDYAIHGPCMNDLGKILDSTKRGELGISESTMMLFSKRVRKVIDQLCSDPSDEFITVRSTDTMLALCELLSSLPSYQKFKGGLEPDATERNIPQVVEEFSEDAYSILRLFLNEALLHKLEVSNSLKGNHTSIDKRANTISPMSITLPPNTPEYPASPLKAVSSLSRRPTTQNFFPSEFRSVSVIFVKLKSDFNSQNAQTIFETFVAILKKWEGTFQQFAVDDKGQTMLGCFGLPPWTHERDALYALKAAVEFEAAYQDLKCGGEISISVASGELLFSRLGNQERADTSLLGDTVNVAARLMSLGNHFDSHKESIIIKCDLATYSLTKEDFEHISLGERKVKGKQQPIQVFGVRRKDEYHRKGGDKKNRIQRAQSRSVFGYVNERKVLDEAVEEWLGVDIGRTVVVEGKSGMGKSRLLDTVVERIVDSGIQYSLNQGSDIKQYSPYLSIQSLMNFIFRRYLDTEEQTVTYATGVSIHNLKRSQSTLNGRRNNYTPSVRSGRVESTPQTAHSQNEDGKKWDENERISMKFLSDMGENASLAPLLTEVLPFVTIPETAYTKKLDPDVRRNLLKSMIVRLLNKSMESERFGIIFDDVQWMDSASLEVLSEVIQKCPKALIFLFMRPLPENALKIFAQILSSPKIQKLSINGVTELDVKQILLHKFTSFGMADVSPRVVNVIFLKSEGSPLTIDTICESAKTNFQEVFSVSPGNILEFNGSTGEKKLDGLTRSIKIFCEELPFLGSTLTLTTSQGVSKLRSKISNISFIVMTPFSTSYRKIPMTSTPIAITFVTSKLCKSFRDLTESHLQAALYFESLIEDSSRECLLPLLAYHYRKTEVFSKQILYLGELSMLRTVGVTSFTETELEMTYTALKLLGRPFAKDLRNPKKDIGPAMLYLFRVWRKTRGGARPLPAKGSFPFGLNHKVKSETPQMSGTEAAEYLCYQNLYALTAYTDILSKDTSGLAIIKLLTFTVANGYRDRVKYSGMLYQLGFSFMWAIPPVSKFLINHGRKVEITLASDDMLAAMEEWYGFKGLCLLNNGELTAAQECFEKFQRFFVERQGMNWVMFTYCQMQIILSCRGDISTLDETLEEACTVNGTWRTFNSRIFSTRRILANEIEAAKALLTVADESVAKNVREKERQVVFALNRDPPELWFNFIQGNFPAMLDHLKGLSKTFETLRTPISFPAVDTINMLPLQILMMYLGRDLSSTTENYVWSADEKVTIVKLLQPIHLYIHGLARKLKLGLYVWPMILLEAGQLIFEGQLPKARRQILNGIKKDGALLKEMHLQLACSSIYLCLLEDDQTSRQRYYNDALEFFEARGHVITAKWLYSIRNLVCM
ncbi:hypothetical protein HDV05_001578 [Chytridiales sp. JEL 0842]|nr:hypothetical protein HDV05_001578 [Chytridiales sp. JEL 0842]